MKILFLCHYFPPEVNAPASRTYEHCKEWIDLGHEVTVVTSIPSHPRGEVYTGYNNKLFQIEKYNGINVVRVWTYLAANKGFAKRTLNYLSFMFSAFIVSFRLSCPDVVISTSPQFFCGLAGHLVSVFKRSAWVLEVRDLWPDSILAVGAIKNSFIITLLRSLEMFAYKRADKIVSVTNSFKQFMIDKGIPAEKIVVIKNGVDLNLFKIQKVDKAYKEKKGLPVDSFIVSYFGTHGIAHHLETILEAADKLRDHKRIHFLLAGDGAKREHLLEICQKKKLENITMLPQLPKQEMPTLWSITDVSVVLLKNLALFRTVIPSKIFESMAMKKPVLLGVDGESRELVESSKSGIYIEPENSDMLAEKIIMLESDRVVVESMGGEGRRFVEKCHDRRVLAKQYEQIIQQLLNTYSESIVSDS